MLLTAVATRDELQALIRSVTPLRYAIDERRGRSLTLSCAGIDLVPRQGVRLHGAARMTWDVAGVVVPVTIQAWQLLLALRVATRGPSRVLAFEPTLETLDLKLVPGFLDATIVSAITETIARNREKLAWNFARTLSKRLALSVRIAPARTFAFRVLDGAIMINEADVRMTVRGSVLVGRGAAEDDITGSTAHGVDGAL